ncbi:MAG: type II toxin-antitoxin system HicB family antitoxin [Dehalococcoidales bacterium]|nr:type II toxin-antitoxin system HicB family antitoxin [Dehalococcoidales bacterium]
MTTDEKRKPLDYYLKLQYPVTLIPDETGGYAVEIEDLPGCISQGETVEEAVKMIEEARCLWLEVAHEEGVNIPLPHCDEKYSGKFFIRAPKSLHRKLDEMADKEGVSLNQFLVATLSKAVGVHEGRSEYKATRTKKARAKQ